MSDTEKLNLIKEAFKNDLFATLQTGIEIEDANVGYARCKMPVTPHHMNAANTVMGGAIYTLADFTFAVAANYDRPLTVTLSGNINFISSPKDGYLISEAQMISETKRTCVIEVTITDSNDKLVAKLTGTGYRKA